MKILAKHPSHVYVYVCICVCMYMRNDRRREPTTIVAIRDMLGTGNGYGRGFPWTIFATATRWIRRRADCLINLFLSIDQLSIQGQPTI